MINFRYTNKVKGDCWRKNFISSKQQKISLYKDLENVQKKWTESVTIYGNKDQQRYYTVKTGMLRCKRIWNL